MRHIAQLLETMVHPDEPRMRAQGYALWLVWNGALHNVVAQTIEDYGGLSVAQAEGQGLWFFFSSDAFLSAARLQTWARFNSLAVTSTVMPAVLALGEGRSLSLELTPNFKDQRLEEPEGFQIWVADACREAGGSIPGLTLTKGAAPGLQGVWHLLDADPRLPYQASLGWYALLRPLGNPLDKQFQTGWHFFFEEIGKILQRNKFRYTINDFFLMFPLETLRQLKGWVVDYLTLVARLKEEKSEHYWPCSLVVVDKKGLNFNNELPKKVTLDWDQLASDYPHMSFRNALLLGPECVAHEVRFSEGGGPDVWCNVSMAEAEEQSGNTLPLLVAGNLVLGKHQQCFYCGQRSHEHTECPTRHFPERDKNVWKRVATMDLAAMKNGIKAIDAKLAGGELEAIAELHAQDTVPGVLLRAIYDIDGFMQIRSIALAWRTKGKLPPGSSGEDLVPVDNNPVWEMLRDFPGANKLDHEKALGNLAMRFPRDCRIRSLQGFCALERGDMTKALNYWKEAETMSPAGFLQAWHTALQARVHESQGRFAAAKNLYELAARACPAWLDAEYRRAVTLVKTGFADRGFAVLYPLIEADPHYFNRALLDPEMERGQVQILTSLSTVWVVTESKMQEEKPLLEKLRREIAAWFPPEHPFFAPAEERIKRLSEMNKYNNYVPFQAAINARQALEKDVQQVIHKDTKTLRTKFKGFVEKLGTIRQEAAWFPFPKAMLEFNKNYNECVQSMNWALHSNLSTAEAFRKAQLISVSEAENIQKLEKRLGFLRLIRDATIFCLTMLRTFFWIEIIGLLLVLVGLPLALFYGEKIDAVWVAGIPDVQRWQIQKAATLIISFFAMGVALLRTLFRFEAIRDKIMEKARSSGGGAASKAPPRTPKASKVSNVPKTAPAKAAPAKANAAKTPPSKKPRK